MENNALQQTSERATCEDDGIRLVRIGRGSMSRLLWIEIAGGKVIGFYPLGEDSLADLLATDDTANDDLTMEFVSGPGESVLIDEESAPVLDDDDGEYSPKAVDPASKEAVDALEVKPWRPKEEDGGVGDAKEMCAVCQEELGEGEDVACMPCPTSHVFHAACLLPWLDRSRFCPLCWFGLPPAQG